MLQVLQSSSENVFVPLTVGGGIREYTDSTGKEWSSLEVAAQYFRAGMDIVNKIRLIIIYFSTIISF